MTGPEHSLTTSNAADTAVPDAGTGSSPSTSTPPVRDGASSSGVPSVPTGSTSGSTSTTGNPTGSRRVYSPSQTADWLTCPILRQFKRPSTLRGEEQPHVWEPRGSEEWTPNRLVGTAVQEGYNVYLRERGAPSDLDEAAEGRVEDVIRAGFVDQPKYTVEGLVKLVLRGVQALLDADLYARHQIIDLDEPLSYSRPDIISRHETQGLGHSDLKVAFRIDERYRPKRMSEYETDDQFWHYAWEIAEHLGEPVKWFRPIQLILTPKATVLKETFQVDPERLAFWLESARAHWDDMQAEDEGRKPIAGRWQSCLGGKYGPCVAYDFCHKFHRDPIQATLYYQRVPK